MIMDQKDPENKYFWPQNLNTDEQRLRQIVINLISNAIKYTSKGYVKI